MDSTRLQAFSDGVIAILITIMVLELKTPEGASLDALRPLVPTLASYLLSFIYLGIYWTNHHHLFQVASRVSGAALWANLHLLFWLSLVPVGTAWLGGSGIASGPVIVYGVILLMAGLAYSLLIRALLAAPGQNSLLADAIGRDTKGNISLALYVAGIVIGFLVPMLSVLAYVLVALIWIIPDRRVETLIHRQTPDSGGTT